tara:strand:+ start:281 stop:1510 length:1230 start_codon:yes stop_codon:yes gene_type:complete
MPNKSTIDYIPAEKRLLNLDVIRGTALLGILIMNIQSFSMINAAYSNPLSFGDFSGLNKTVYYFSHVFADQKFMTIFSVLFGASILLVSSGNNVKGLKIFKIHYRRMIILACIGLLHLYYLWYGDILFIYAVMGMLAYPVRNTTAKFLLITAFLLLIINAAFSYLASAAIPHMSQTDIQELVIHWKPSSEAIEEEIIANQSNWIAQMDHRTHMATEMLFSGAFYYCRVLALMLIGMAMMKLNFFGERFSNRSLLLQAILCLLLGVLIIINRLNYNILNNFPIESMFSQENYWGSLIMAYAYICLIIVFCRFEVLNPIKSCLAQVGRLALTNYLAQTFICTFIFYGWGLGKFGTFERKEQLLLVICIWVIQIFFSVLWVKKFRYGPFEWLWRSLTYGSFYKLKNSNGKCY